MWEAPPPDTARDFAGDGQEVLSAAAIEAVLADFRSWLQHLSTASAGQEKGPSHFADSVDLHTLLGQFVAVRHEVNLQTKAARSGQEQTGLALQQLSQALEALRQAQVAAQQTNQQAQDEALRPLLKTLLDVHDAFSLAEREIRRTRENMLPLLDELAVEPLASGNGCANAEEAVPILGLEPDINLDGMLSRPLTELLEAQQPPGPRKHGSRLKSSVWQKWFGRRNQTSASESATLTPLEAQQRRLLTQIEEQRKALIAQRETYQRLLNRQNEERQQERAVHQQHQEQIERAARHVEQLIDSVVTGYRMSLQRLERALQQSGLEPIPCVGERFDPEQMEVVAAVADSGRPAGEVIEEVRRGYRWHGRLFRYAQVSVAKPDTERRRDGATETE
jgi:molecular chaperone GrpE (heat shock protein)